MRRGAIAVALAVGAIAGGGGYAWAQYPPNPPGMGGGGEGSAEPAAEVEARGDAVDGNLGFVPNDVSVEVGDLVRWRNVDDIAPHTATEQHFLWRLTGDYGIPPFTGFGPGETRERNFEAGTFNYFCEVHGAESMSGVVRVPVELRQARGERVKAKWGTEELPEGQVFDVQRRKGEKWQTVLKGTRALKETFDSKVGKTEQFRARLREAADRSAASDWSPPAKLKVT